VVVAIALRVYYFVYYFVLFQNHVDVVVLGRCSRSAGIITATVQRCYTSTTRRYLSVYLFINNLSYSCSI